MGFVSTGRYDPTPPQSSASPALMSRTALRTVLCDAQSVDRGSIPYHYWQQFVGYPDRSPTSHCKPGGIFAGQDRNNQTWREDRDLALKQAGQPILEERGLSMAQILTRICDEEIDVFV